MSEKTTSTVCYIVIVIDFSLISFFFFFFFLSWRGVRSGYSQSQRLRNYIEDLEEKIEKMRVNKKTIVIRRLSNHKTKLKIYICLAIH